MGLIGKLFGSGQDPLVERAKELVAGAQIMAVSSLMPLSERFHFLEEIQPDDWDFFVTVATVFMGATRLDNLRLNEGREDKLMALVASRLSEWNKDGIDSFEDCKAFFTSAFDSLTNAGYDSRFVASDSVGKWIVWNVLRRAPQSDEERLLVRAIGGIVTHAVFDWWEK